MSYIKELLKDRDNPYEIDLELKVRKIFENNTDYHFEIQKNDNEFGVDLIVFKYDIEKNKYKKRKVAFIEVEVSENWVNEYPVYWRTYSFLKRKVFEFDNYKNVFTDNLKKDYYKTIYIIFNKSFSDCICQSMSYISSLNSVRISAGDNERSRWMLRTGLNDQNIKRGIDEVFEFCDEFIQLRAFLQ